MQTNEVKIEKIKAYEKNAKKHGEEQIKLIANSIKQFGFRQPIVLDKNNEIVIGHGRYEAAKLLDMKTVPCIMADDLSEEEVKALRIADNKLNESPWDFSFLDEELASITDIDMTDFGFLPMQEFDDKEFDDLFKDEEKKEKEPNKIQCPHCGEWFEI